MGLKSQTEWLAYCKSGKKPDDIPANPNRTYAGGWMGYGDWLGTGAVARSLRQYRSFAKARAFMRGLGLKSSNEWLAYRKSPNKPDDIPTNPNTYYANDGWAGMGDWLGYTRETAAAVNNGARDSGSEAAIKRLHST